MLAAEREARRQQILRDFLRRELADQLALLIAKALLLEARSDARVQQHRVDRLGQVVLCAHLDALDHAVELVEGRRHDHRDVAEMRVELQLRENLVAVELGHQDVEQHQVEVLATQQVERLAAVFCEDDGVPLLLQTAAEQEPVHPVVVRRSGSFRAEERRRSRRGVERSAASAFSRAGVLSLDSIDELGGAVQLAAPRSLLELSAELGEAVRRRTSGRSTSGYAPPAAAPPCRPASCVVRSVATRAGASLRNVSITSARKPSPPSSLRLSIALASRLAPAPLAALAVAACR